MTGPDSPEAAFLYARISADDKKGSRKAEGVHSQLHRLHAECDRRGIPRENRREFVDNDISASEFEHRERREYVRMCEAIASARNTLVLATEPQRLVRQLGEGETFQRLMIRTGNPLTCLSFGDVDLNSDSGDTMWVLMLFMGRMESKNISRRSKRRNEVQREQGVMRAHTVPFGYADVMYEKRVPAEVAMLRRLMRLVVAGAGPRECIREMTAKGFMSPRTGKPYSRTAIRYMLTNPAYAGYVHHKGEIMGKAVNIKKPVFSDAERTAILTAWSERSAEHEATHGPNPNRNVRVHVMSGLLRCGKCMGVLQIGSSEGRPAWRCPSRSDGGCGGISRGYSLVKEVTDAWIRESLTAARISAVEVATHDPERVKLEGEIRELEARAERLQAELANPDAVARPDDIFPALRQVRDGITTRGKRLASMVRTAERALPPDALAIWDDDRPETLATRRAMAATLIDYVVCLPVGRVGPRGAGPDSVQVFPRGNGTTPWIAEIPGDFDTEEIAS